MGITTPNGVIGTPNNIVFVSSKSDLPVPVGGVISLEDDTLYWFTGDVDLAGDRIVAGQNTTIVGSSSENASISSTGLTGTALITSEWSLPIRNIAITADIAVDLDASGNANQALDWNAVNFLNCGEVGTIANYTNFIYINGALLNSGGFTFDGSFGTVGFSGCLLDISSGSTAITFPSTATITRRIRIDDTSFVTLSGETSINVSTSATLPVESYILEKVNFSGGGTYLSGVLSDDNKAWFINCRGVLNSAEIGQYTMNGNATATTISATGTPVKVSGTTTASSINQKFSHSNNRLTYTGAITRDFQVTSIVSALSNNNNQVGLYIAKNGIVIDESETYATTSGTGRAENITVQTIVQLSQNDYVEVWTENNTVIRDVTVQDLNTIVKGLN